jgi:hypothetical protein
MVGWGLVLIVLGIGSFVLRNNGMEFFLLAWIDNWGESSGNLIRIGMAVLGFVLVAVDRLRAWSKINRREQ